MDLQLLLHLAWTYVLSLWVADNGDEFGRGLATAMVPWLVAWGVAVFTFLYVLAHVVGWFRRSHRRAQ